MYRIDLGKYTSYMYAGLGIQWPTCDMYMCYVLYAYRKYTYGDRFYTCPMYNRGNVEGSVQ